MLGNAGDDLANMWGFIGTGFAMGAIGLALQGPIWRKGFFGAALVLVLCGLCWSLIRKIAPALDPVLTSITSNPSNWFLLVFIVVLSLAGHQYRKELLADRQRVLMPVDQAPAFDDGDELVRRFEAHEAGAKNGMEQIWRDLNALKASISQSDHRPTTRVLRADILKLQNIAAAICAKCACEYVLVGRVPFPPVIPEHLIDNAIDFITICEQELIALRRYAEYQNVMRNGEVRADQVLERDPPPEFRVASDKLAFRKNQIVRERAELLRTFFVKIKSDADNFLKANAPVMEQVVNERESAT